MPRENVALVGFNRGLISPLAFARIDLKRVSMAAETMTNWMPRVFGSMMLRPGLKYIGSSRSDAKANYIEFVFAIDDVALLEITDSNMRIWIDDALITRASVSSAVTNGTFDSNLTGWTDADESGGTSDWVTGGYMGLTGNGSAAAIRRQQVTVVSADQNVEHALRIVIQRGPVTLKVGSSSGSDDYINETTLRTGTHSLAFTPTGSSFWIQFESRLKRQVLVNSCTVESSGVVSITAPWLEADLDNLRDSQSGDVIFVACSGYQQRRIERRATRSWSVVTYDTEDGPFRLENVTPITITPSALSGNITLTASAPLFRSGHVGALYRITSNGQQVSASISAQNQFTNAIRVTGVDATRVFTVSIDEVGAGANTFTLQRSLESDTGPWTDVQQWTADVTTTYDDGLDNQIAWYRLGVKTGDYGSDTHTVSLSYTVGSIDGVVRITSFTSSTSVAAEVITDLGGTSATDTWAEGEWSTYRGFPTSVNITEGRLWWAGKDGVWGSVSDAFESFDDETEGDSGPISRSIGSGPVDTINWILALQRLIVGGEGAEFTCKSSSFDEPLTPTNFMIKQVSTQGSAAIGAITIDKIGVYVQRGGTRVMQISYEGETGEYGSIDLTALIPEATQPRIVRMAVQRQPDTRVHCVRSDGKVAILVFDRSENVLCWSLFETDGVVEDVAVLPGAVGDSEDVVYYHVRRTINGATKRYLEQWALESECEGSTLNKQADSFILYSGAATTTITGLDHLEAESVVVWGNGASLGSYTVSGGQITGLTSSVTSAVIGVGYTAQWKSTKLAYAAGLGTALTQRKKVQHLGVIMRNTHASGLQYGPDFTNLDDLPGTEDEADVSSTSVHSTYDEEPFEFPGSWDTDARLCLQATAPKPCNLLAAVISVETHDKY